MKKYFLIILFSWIVNFSYAQTAPEGTVPLINALLKSWDAGDVGKAVPLSLEIYRISPSLFAHVVHISFAKKIDNEKAGLSAMSYLKALTSQQNERLNQIVEPLYNWGKIKYSNNPVTISENFSALKEQLTEGSTYATTRTERYCLFSLNELAKKEAVSDEEQWAMLLEVIEKLENRYSELDEQPRDKAMLKERAWTRYLLSYSYHYCYTQYEADPDFLKKASLYSVDQEDILQTAAFVYDADILTRKKSSLGYKIDYFAYLQDKGKHEEALEVITSVAFLNPTDKNLEMLKAYYAGHSSEGPFEDYWQSYIHQHGVPAPKLRLRFSKYDRLDLKSAPGVWVYLDFWGTWSPPCVKEMPDVQGFYHENITRGGVPKLKVYTLSYSSKNLSRFMDDNVYTFPVCEIDQREREAFAVTTFPSRILISPEGNYIRIPNGVDWEMFVKNYVLL